MIKSCTYVIAPPNGRPIRAADPSTGPDSRPHPRLAADTAQIVDASPESVSEDEAPLAKAVVPSIVREDVAFGETSLVVALRLGLRESKVGIVVWIQRDKLVVNLLNGTVENEVGSVDEGRALPCWNDSLIAWDGIIDVSGCSVSFLDGRTSGNIQNGKAEGKDLQQG